MDLADLNSVKTEKAKATRRYNRIRTIGRIFRAAELCLALLFLLWTFTRLPFVVKMSGEFLRSLAAVVSGHLFVFVLGNSIVVALVARSDVFFPSSSSQRVAEAEFYEAFVRSGENRAKPFSEHLEEEIVYDDKEVIVNETFSDSNSNSNPLSLDMALKCADADETDFDLDSDPESDNPKVYRRSKSEISTNCSPEKSAKGSLRRSDTDILRKSKIAGDEISIESNVYPEDKLTTEEFQKTIEAFIAKQLMFRRQESHSIVLQNQA